ncbi:DUF1080 domain-containing protein [bacterium]|nr:DUF1080 domain-containing protein [bacterium]
MKIISTVIILITLVFVSYLSAEEKFEWNFEKTENANIPDEWKIEATNARGEFATWKVLFDSQDEQKTKVLGMIKANDDFGGAFNLCWTDNIQIDNIEIETKFKAIQGIEDQGGGLIWRVQDKDNYYIARANPLENNFRMYSVKDGARKTLDSAKVKVPSNKWHTIKIIHRGTHIEGYLNGKKYLEWDDATFPNAGGFGLWTKADAVTYFDDFKVKRIK